MRIAIACDGLRLSDRPAQCESFLCYAVDLGVVTSCRNLPHMDKEPGAAATLLDACGADAMVARAIDPELAAQLADLGIEAVCQDAASPRAALDAYLARTLMGCA